MIKEKKMVSILLTMMLATGAFSGCNNSGGDNKTTTAGTTKPVETTAKPTEAQTEPEEDEEDESKLFPAGNLNGATIRFLDFNSLADLNANPESGDLQPYEKEDREKKVKQLEEKYNCKIEIAVKPVAEWDALPDEFIKAHASGQQVADAMDISRMWLPRLVASNVLLDLTDYIKDSPYASRYIETATWLDRKYGIATGVGGEGLIYNRKMIKDAGMTKTPSEMFQEGNWTYDDFYNYCVELKSKLKEDEYPFFIDPYYWSLFAVAANGENLIDPSGNLNYLKEPVIESMEFLQKLFDANLVRSPNINDAGNPDYWGTPGVTFEEGKEVVMTHRAAWQMEGLVDKLDFGFVPYPWGSNVTIGTTGNKDSYKTLSDNYKSSFFDAQTKVLLNGAEKKGDPAVIMNMFMEGINHGFVVKEYIAETTGVELEQEELDYRWFNNMLDVELWYWLGAKERFEGIGSLGLGFGATVRTIINEKQPVRSALEAKLQQDNATMKEKGFVK